jgi:perosamine synthetase
MRIARKYNLKVVEDAAESLGSYYTEGIYRDKFTGSIGDFGVYSFNGNKIITTGSGGMIVSNSKKLANKARYLVNQAKDDPVRSVHNEIGYNFRLTNLQSAFGLAQLERLECFISSKKKNYELYKELLRPIDGVEMLGIPEGTAPNYWFYSLLIDKKEYGMDREKLMDYLTKKKIQSRPIWYLNLPCGTGLQEKQINYIASVICNLAGRN